MKSRIHTILSVICLIALFFKYSGAQTQPDDIPGLHAWYQSDSVILNAGFVQQWYDLSGNNFHLLQPSSTRRPQHITNEINGYPALLFDGVNDFMDVDFGSTISQPNTVFVIFKTANSGLQYIYDGSTTRHSLRTASNNVALASIGVSVSYPKPVPFDYAVFSAVHNITDSRIYENGILKASGSLGSDGLEGMTIGSYDAAAGLFLNGQVVEIILYDGLLSDIDRVAVEDYLFDRYVPLLDLGQDIVQYGFCPLTLDAGEGFVSYLWSDGSSADTLEVTGTGTYWVETVDAFGRTAYDTINVMYPSIVYPALTSFCSGDSTEWNPGLGNDYFYLWSDGEIDTSNYISNAGNYHVEITDTNGCVVNSDTLNFIEDNYPLTADLGNDTSLCSGNLIALQVGAAETVSYLWPDMSTGPTYAVDTSGAYFVEATNVNGCVLNDTIQITITGTAPTAFFTPADVCLGNTSVLTDASTTQMGNPLVLWNWDFGDTNTDNNQNTTHTYLAPGVYTVELYIEAQDGCGAYHQDTVSVFDVPVASFSFNGYCSADSVYFTDESTNGDGTINQWSWDFGQPASGSNTSTLQHPAHLYDEVNTFTVTLQVTDDNGCSDMTSSAVAIDPSPQASFTVNDGCLDQSLDLTNNSTVPSPGIIVSYLWDFGDGTTSSSSNPSKNYSTYGDYDVSVTVTTSDGCIDLLSQPVTIHALPTPQFSASNACAGNYTEFNDLSAVVNSTIDSSRWIIDVFDTLYGSPIYFVFDTEGDHFIKLTTVSAFGCSKDTIKKVVVGPNVTASFTTLNAGMLVAGTDVIFDNTSQGADAYNWDLGDGTLSNDESPTHQYAESLLGNTVDVTLESVSTVWACSDTVQQQFTIAEAELDLALTKIFVMENAGYYDLAVQMKNEGSARIEGVDLKVHLQNGTILLEHYPDTIYSGQTVIYTLNSKPSAFYSTQDDEEGYVCIKGTPFTSPALVETDLADNEICRNAEGEQPILVGPYPNPAIDQIELGVLLSKSGSVDLAIYDERGREVLSIYNNADLPAGYHISVIDLTPYEGAVYVIRMVSGDTVAVRKLVKK